MTAASRYGSMMLSRAAARQRFAAPLPVRTFSTSQLARSPKDAKDRPVRSNPLVGNYVPAQPAQAKADEAPPSTEHAQSSKPPSPDHAPTSSAEVPPNSDMPPPPPLPAESQGPNATEEAAQPEADQQHTYNAASPSGYVDIAKILENSAAAYAKSINLTTDPMNQPRMRTKPVAGRTVFLEGNTRSRNHAHSPEHAFSMLDTVIRQSKIKNTWHRQRFHERPGMKRKRLKMARWRVRFKKGFKATTARVRELKKQGW